MIRKLIRFFKLMATILHNELKKDEPLLAEDDQFKTSLSFLAESGKLGGTATKTDILYYSATSVSTYSTTAGQVLLTTTLPANTLGTASSIEFEVLLEEFKLSGTDASGTYRITFTTVLNSVQGIHVVSSIDGPATPSISGKFKGVIIADGANKQKLFTMSELGTSRIFSTVTSSTQPLTHNGANVNSFDAGISNASPITFEVRATNSHNAANHGVKTFLAIVKKFI